MAVDAAGDEASGWRAYREDLPDEGDQPAVAVFFRRVRRVSSTASLPSERIYASAWWVGRDRCLRRREEVVFGVSSALLTPQTAASQRT